MKSLFLLLPLMVGMAAGAVPEIHISKDDASGFALDRKSVV
jgi:hypothetical protein